MKKRRRIISLLLAALMMFDVPAQAIYAAESTTMQETVNAEDENEALEVVQIQRIQRIQKRCRVRKMYRVHSLLWNLNQQVKKHRIY